MQYLAIPCNIMQYHAILCDTMQYHAIPCYIYNCWRSVPLPCGQYNGHFFYEITTESGLSCHPTILPSWCDDIEKSLGQKSKLKLSLFFEPWSLYVCQVVKKSVQKDDGWPSFMKFVIWNETNGFDIKVFFCLMPFTLLNRSVGEEFHLDQISGAPRRMWFKDPSEQMWSHKHEIFCFIPLLHT